MGTKCSSYIDFGSLGAKTVLLTITRFPYSIVSAINADLEDLGYVIIVSRSCGVYRPYHYHTIVHEQPDYNIIIYSFVLVGWLFVV